MVSQLPRQRGQSKLDLIALTTAARSLARQVRAKIHKARELRRAAVKVRHSPKTQKAIELQLQANKANAAACRLLGRLVHAKSQIEISLLSPEDRLRSVREALEKLDFTTRAPASGRWPAAVRFDEEDVLHALDKFEMLLDTIPITGTEERVKIDLSSPLKNGQFCDRVIDEIRKIRHLYPANTVTQIKTDYPNFLVWEVINHPDTDAEDRDILFHPGRWGPVVGYAIKLLARHFVRSEETIRRWRKSYRKHARRSNSRK